MENNPYITHFWGVSMTQGNPWITFLSCLSLIAPLGECVSGRLPYFGNLLHFRGEQPQFSKKTASNFRGRDQEHA